MPASRIVSLSRVAAVVAGLLFGAGAMAQPVPLNVGPGGGDGGFRTAMQAAASGDVAEFLASRGWAAFWTADDPVAATRRAALLAALDTAPAHALPLGRHDAGALRRAFHDLRSHGDRARLEVRLTQALLDFAHDLHSGILDPARIDRGIVRDLPRLPPEDVLAGFATDPAGFVRGLAPQNPEYARLVRARRQLLDQIAAGGWGAPVPAKALRPGEAGPAVVALRDRLAAMGYLGRSATRTYDGAIAAAVRAFQFDHGLTADGTAGPATITAVNQPPETRLQAITVAMERERWINIPRGARHIVVNLTDFSARIIDDGKVTFATKAVVGATHAEKHTPEFSRLMTYMELNPDWTVPPGIIRRDYLPRLQANPGALAHLQVIDSRGRVVPRGAVDFAAYSARNFPFNLRQPPGPGNSLGRVKFMFPNPWSIYLHDTPEKHLFTRDVRTYSSGCIRLNDPFDFAYILLARQEADPRAAFHKVLDSGRQERIFLKDPVPVHLDYRTAFTDERGRVQYRADIYGRDAAIWRALVKAGIATPGEGV